MSTLSLLLVAVPFALLGFTAPFGTTILGVVAIGQIKRSKGRLYGMPLAVFNALVFPLIFFDLVVMAFSLFAGKLFFDRVVSYGGRDPTAIGECLVFLLVAGLLAWLDWRIIRGVWRKVTS